MMSSGFCIPSSLCKPLILWVPISDKCKIEFVKRFFSFYMCRSCTLPIAAGTRVFVYSSNWTLHTIMRSATRSAVSIWHPDASCPVWSHSYTPTHCLSEFLPPCCEAVMSVFVLVSRVSVHTVSGVSGPTAGPGHWEKHRKGAEGGTLAQVLRGPLVFKSQPKPRMPSQSVRPPSHCGSGLDTLQLRRHKLA